ncbi:MAG: hydroxyacid dehydrogenase [Bacteriovoracaceae bacterium]|nr:hydroxyacid dehydrogenase [Bacteriovoracaceae bacterium]
MKPFIVVSDGMDKNLFATLCNMDELEVHPSPKITQDELKQLLPKVSGLVIRSATKVTSDYLEMAPNLKYVIRAGEGTDNIDKVACAQKGVKVSNTPGANSNSAAEHAIALMMTVLRKTAWANESMSNGKWEKSKLSGNELANKKVGIIGFGRIGQIVAKRIAGFEPQVLFYDPIIKTSDISYAQKVDTLKEIFSECDIISLHLPLIEATTNLITMDLLGQMKSDAILINAARGKIVNEDDLYQILSEGKIKGAGFDVFATEPLEESSKLRTLPNLVLTPHLGASTAEAQVRVGEMAVNQLVEYFVKNNLLNEVSA